VGLGEQRMIGRFSGKTKGVPELKTISDFLILRLPATCLSVRQRTTAGVWTGKASSRKHAIDS
jgi:hypothetical protein